MSTKPKITDEMVKRFVSTSLRMDCTGAWVCADVRKGLEAALTEPEEIPVSEGMATIGRTAWHKWHATSVVLDGCSCGPTYVYRAMEAKRREEDGVVPELAPRWHLRTGGLPYRHRRADDPK